MQESNISWCDYTWNPTHGCSKVESPGGESGCTNCYAARISQQYGYTEKSWTPENAAANVTVHPERLEQPYELDEPATVFVNSMSDLFHGEVPEDYIREVLGVIRNTPHVVYQILTKRPGRAAHMDVQWPPNVWLGTSVEDDRVTERLDLLRDCGAETLFVSFEPLIGPVGEVDLTGYDWAIVGGESAPDDARREMEHEWARDIRRQCRRDDVAFYFKQSSGRSPETGKALTVENSEYGVYVQRTFEEMPAVSPVVERARDQLEAVDA